MTDSDSDADPSAAVHEDRLWIDNGWTARVVKNEDDEGWAVEMIKDGEPEPAPVGPWTMGRDKKNPKPLDSAADEDDPYAELSALDAAGGVELARVRVGAGFRLSAQSASAWIESGFRKPGHS